MFPSFLTLCSYLFECPLRVAAFAGHAEIVKLLMNDTNLPERSSYRRDSVVTFASRAGNFAIVDIALDPNWEIGSSPTEPDLITKFTISAAEKTKTVAEFRHYFQQVRGKIRYYQDKWLPDRLRDSAANGALELVEELLDLGAPVDGKFEDISGPCRPISLASIGGHEDVVRLLLKRGAKLDKALIWAAAGGNRKIVRLLMKIGQGNDTHYEAAFVEAILRENVGMVACLEVGGATLNERTIGKAVKVAIKNMVSATGVNDWSFLNDMMEDVGLLDENLLSS